jgi:protein kinase-like protein/Kelch motif protein
MQDVAAALPAYEIGGELGRGSTGLVLAARHRQLGRDVAVKILPPDMAHNTEVRRRFVAEAKLLASFSHVHIVPVYDFVEQDGLCVLVLERLDGGTLHDYGRAGVDGRGACAAILALCSALQYAHGRGVLHRDVKPSNVLIAEDGLVKVTDFGIAKVLGGRETLATRTGFVLGTPAYMAPEQAGEDGAEPGPATDVYGAATVLYELLAGTLPYPPESNPLQMLYNHVHLDPEPLSQAAPDVPRGLADVVMRALERDPIARYRSADEFGVAIANAAVDAWGSAWLAEAPFRFAASGPILTAAHSQRASAGTLLDLPAGELPLATGDVVPVGELRDEPAPKRGRRIAIALAVAVALALAGAAAVILAGDDDDPQPSRAGGTPPPARLASSSWTELPRASFPQQQMPGAVAGGTVWLVGGLSGPTSTRRTQKFDTAIDRWQTGPELPGNLNHAMAVEYDGRLLVMGGWIADGSDLTARTSDRVYELRDSEWVEAGRMTSPRAAGAAAVVGDRIVVVGGVADGRPVASTDVFDGTRWTRGADMPTPREHLAAASDGRYLYAVGGTADGADQKALERYDPESDSWETLAGMRVARNGLGAAFVGGRLFAVGGETSTEVLDTVESYDPSRDRWSNGDPLRTPRHGMAVVSIGDTLYALGGARGVGHEDSTDIAESLAFDRR